MTFLKKIEALYLTAKKTKEPLDLKTKSKDFKVTAKEQEVVARVNIAELVFRVTINEDKLKTTAQKSFDSDFKYWERGSKDEPKPNLDTYIKAEREFAAEELSKAKKSDIYTSKDGSIKFPKYDYLKAEILFKGKPIQNLADVEYKYGGGEVFPVEDSEYSLS